MTRLISALVAFILSTASYALNFASPFSDSPKFLPVEQAFILSVSSDKQGQVWATWEIKEGYYLYRHQLKVDSKTEPSLQFGDMPKGELKQDPYFGEVEVYHQKLKLPLNITEEASFPKEVAFELKYQGCAEGGLCYPPQIQPMTVSFPKKSGGISTAFEIKPSTAQQVNDTLLNASIMTMLITMIGLGLLLTFTPCVLPMIPIISAIIVGQKASGMRGLKLTFVYVLGMAFTYAILGALAGWFGSRLNIQAALQSPTILTVSAVIFTALALAMFGVYELRLPQRLTTKLEQWSSHNHATRSPYLGLFIAGVLATLVVSPCVSAPLAGVLLYISSQGDPGYGAMALFAMGMGMGIPLLCVGFLGSRLLPKAGLWLNDIKVIMGFAMLGMAIWLINRWLPSIYHLYLWGALSLALTSYFLHRCMSGASHPLRWFIILFSSVIGATSLTSALSGSSSPLISLQTFTSSNEQSAVIQTPYERTIGSLEELNDIQKTSTKPVVIDLYADWCISCKITEDEIFKQPEIARLLNQVTFIKVDITENNSENQAFLRHFKLYGPPAMLFFDKNTELLSDYSLIGEPTLSEVKERLQALLVNTN